MAPRTPAFTVKPDDTEDVAIALQSASACSADGELGEALKWLRRAVEAASEAEQDERALELAKLAADLTTQIAQAKATPPKAALPSAPVASRGALAASKPTPLVRPLSPLPARQVSKEPPKKPDRKSLTNEASRGTSSGAKGDKGSPSTLDPPRKRTTSRTDRTEAKPRPSKADDMDAWPTEVVGGGDLPSSVRVVDVDREPKSREEAGAVRAAQAVRVLVWREEGSVQITRVGSSRAAPSTAVEAIVVGLDAYANLLELLAD
jgi:hypothetical protein